jgi:hypothetical protein
MSAQKEQSAEQTGKEPGVKSGGGPAQKPTAHSDDDRSALPERGDQSRKQAPSDRPGKQPGEGEPPVG